MSFSDVYIFSQWIFWKGVEECTYEIDRNTRLRNRNNENYPQP